VRDKNALSSTTLQKMANEKTTPNPMIYIASALSTEDRFAFSKAFGSLQNVDWKLVRKEIRTLIKEMEGTETKRDEARENTSFVWAPLLIKKNFLSAEMRG